MAPHAGRGGWTWYTGAAGWMYRAGIEGILGLRREGDQLSVRPRLPSAWPGFSATVTFGGASSTIRVERVLIGNGESTRATLDGADLNNGEDCVLVPLDGAPHALMVFVA